MVNVTELTNEALDILSDDALTEISVAIRTGGKSKVAKMTSKILNIPLIEIGRLLHSQNVQNRDTASYRNEFSMVSNAQHRSTVIAKIMKMYSWNQIAVIFQTKRTDDLNHFTQSIGREVSLELIPVETYLNGSVTHHSITRMKSLTNSQVSAILLIYDEANLPQLFQLFRSDTIDLCAVKNNIFLLDLIFSSKLFACDLHTVIGFQVQINKDLDEGLYHPLPKDVLGTIARLQDVLLYDAFHLVANITKTLVTSNRWLSPSRNGKGYVHSMAVANTANFSLESGKVKINGASGNIQFNTHGNRLNMPLNVVNIKENIPVKIGHVDENANVFMSQIPSSNVKHDITNIEINEHLKIVTIVDEPFTFETRYQNGTVKYTGFCIDLLDELARLLNFTYTIYSVKDEEYGRKEGDKWTGMIGDVLYKKADMAVASLTITSSREEVVQFTKPYMELQNSYVRLRGTTMQFDPLQFLKPFTTNMWILTVLAGIFCSIVIYFIDYYSPFGWRQTIKRETGRDGATFNAANSAWFTVASWLLQGGDNTPRSLSGRMFVSYLWFAILIVTSTYTANMAAYFTMKKSVTEKEDIESLLKMGVSFALKQHTAMDQFLQNSEYRVYQQLAQKIGEQKNYVSNASQGIAVARTDPNLLFLGEGPYSEWLMNKDACDLKIVNGILPSRSYGFPVRKGSPISEKISIGISHMVESHFIQNRKDHYWKELSNCKDDSIFSAGITSQGRIEPLQLVGVYGCLVFAGILSILCLFAEKWWKKHSAEKKRKLTRVLKNTVSVRRALHAKSNWRVGDSQKQTRFGFRFQLT
ncbi:glutamate receptor 2-like [Rhopilema esculentum]|uniref:glutamate receptor 2-like n=1 Tax=Rhopilema esculentum TaxID=499914 RepID=UPI0031E3AEDB